MNDTPTSRREFLQLVASAALIGSATPSAGEPIEATLPGLGDPALHISFDSSLRSRLSRQSPQGGEPEIVLSNWAATETLLLGTGERVALFALGQTTRKRIDGLHGPGHQLTLVGKSSAGIEKTVSVALFTRYPGFLFLNVTYRNLSDQPIALSDWRNADREFLTLTSPDQPAPAGGSAFWSYCGSSHQDRRDWVQPVTPGFEQDNFMGMNASDYGGGIPIVDAWQRSVGLAVGHLETRPQLVSLPLIASTHGIRMAIAGQPGTQLQPGEAFATPECFIAAHSGDHFATVDAYRRIMAERGLAAPTPPPGAYEPVWCAWGYERACTPDLILRTLPKVKDLGLGWAVIDDGWQDNVGDWKPDRVKFPGGGPDMRHLADSIRAESLKPRLWVAPLAAAPGSDLLHDHTDMLLLAADGAPQLVSWWNSFYLCPAYHKTVEYSKGLVRRMLGEWRFAGLKIDGQHLNAVAPCYNPAHHHARPEESVEGLQDFFRALYDTARGIDPEVVMELCPCGTGDSLFNFASMNQTPAADPESSWQVRLKGKTLKALLGPGAAFAGDHVELSDGHDDFASTVGIGAVVSTKFTWPGDPKPKDSFLLTPDREKLWRRWIALYNERQLPKGKYLGGLYDIGFDKPETHVIEKSGRFHYALYARSWRGPVNLRGLAAGRYRLRDYFHDRDLGEVQAPGAVMPLEFERFLVIEAIPV